MANKEGFRNSEEWKFIKKWSWRAVGLWVIAGVVANATNWVHIKGFTIPPTIKVG